MMENTDLVMMDVPLQQPLEAQDIPGKDTPRGALDTMYPSHPHPPTPDSSGSNSLIPGKAVSSDGSLPTGDPMTINPAGTGDLDAIFKDLAYLDTTEWSNNREAGLKDFGFLDDSTFRAFCHDPDRLVGTQPLVHPPSIADIWPPPGFFPETFQEAPEKTMNG